MELSFATRLNPERASALPDERVRCRSAQPHRPTLFEVPVPPELRRLGATVRASAVGDRANAPIVVLGGISADCFPCIRPDGAPGWWAGLAGAGRAIDPAEHFIIGVDFAADEGGATAPSTFEQAEVLAAALDRIGVGRPVTIVGASYGGMVGLALAQSAPERVERLVVISAAAEPHPQSTAARELQRRVVSLGLASGRGEEALGIARGMAMLTYRSPVEFEERFDGGISDPAACSCSKPGAYLKARGEAFRSVMSPERFLSLSASIDRHCVDPSKIRAACLIIGATSDQLVFPGDLRNVADRLAGTSELHLLDSLYGHDMFLKEADRVGKIVASFLAKRA
jgi:homoserine O-acetyltransferase